MRNKLNTIGKASRGNKQTVNYRDSAKKNFTKKSLREEVSKLWCSLNYPSNAYDFFYIYLLFIYLLFL